MYLGDQSNSSPKWSFAVEYLSSGGLTNGGGGGGGGRLAGNKPITDSMLFGMYGSSPLASLGAASITCGASSNESRDIGRLPLLAVDWLSSSTSGRRLPVMWLLSSCGGNGV